MRKANERQDTLSDGDVCVCLKYKKKNIISNSALTLRDVKHVRCELGLRADGLIKALERCVKMREGIEQMETDRKIPYLRGVHYQLSFILNII